MRGQKVFRLDYQLLPERIALPKNRFDFSCRFRLLCRLGEALRSGNLAKLKFFDFDSRMRCIDLTNRMYSISPFQRV